MHLGRGRGRPGPGDGEWEKHDQRDYGHWAAQVVGGTAVLDSIGLEVGAGTTFSLLGPSSIRLGELIVLGTPAGDLEIGIAEGTAARLAVSTGHGHVRSLLESATGPEEADGTVEVRGRTSCGDITIHRS